MELEVSAWTRRERVERIAAAERDRRAGRPALALAALGEASEWPARLVVALAKLPEEEGAETRALLESTLDDWAAENGLSLVAPTTETGAGMEPSAEARPTPAPAADAEADPSAVDPFLAADRRAAALDAPIDFDELEQAFAVAEVDPDEMIDVNSVAERVLLEEPLAGDDLEEAGGTGSAVRPVTDAAFAEAPVWPEPDDPSIDAFAFAPTAPQRPQAPGLAGSGRGERTETEARATPDPTPDTTPARAAPVSGRSSRPVALATLERWLVNLENQRRRRAR